MAEHLIQNDDAKENLLSCATYLAETIASNEGRSDALTQIVPRYIDNGQVDLAAQLANTVDDPFVRDKLLMLVAEKCAALNDDEYAFQLIEAIEDSGTSNMALERVALQKSAKDETEAALEMVEGLPHPDNAYADIALHQAIKGDENVALETIERIDFPLARANALQNIAFFNSKNGNGGKAAQLFDRAYDAASDIEHYEEKIRAYVEIAGNLVDIGQNGRSIEILENARVFAERIDGVHRDGLFANISVGFLQAGDLDRADKMLDLVVDKTQMASCMLGFSQVFWNSGDQSEALETLEEAHAILKSQRDHEIRDSAARFRLLGTAAVLYAKFEKSERAIEIAQENLSEMEQLSALAQISAVCSLQGRDEVARQALNAIFEDSTRMFALIGMSDAKNDSGNRETAVELLNEAATLCETVPQHASRSEAYNEFAVRFEDYGDTPKARGFLHDSLENIASIRSEASRSVNLAQLALIYDKYDFTLTAEEKEILAELVRKSESF